MTRQEFYQLRASSPYFIKCFSQVEETILNHTLRIKYGCNKWFDLDTKEQITNLTKHILNYSYDLTYYDDSDYFVFYLDEEKELSREYKEKYMSKLDNVKDIYEYYLDLFFNYTCIDEPIQEDMTSYWLDRIFDLQRLHSLLTIKN